MKYFADLFGRENIVAAHLHRDEETPHIHVTLVPIVKESASARNVRNRQRNAIARNQPMPSVCVPMTS